jgi:hypothetical protein
MNPMAQALMTRVLEADDEDDILKDLAGPFEPYDYWEQVGGDFGDPWIYGGDWFNEHRDQLLHFYGIESEQEREIDPDDVEIPPHLREKIRQKIHDPDLDEPWAQEDLAWLERQKQREEDEIDEVIGHYQYARAAFLNARESYTFYMVNVSAFDEIINNQAKMAPIRQQFDDLADFDSWPLHAKVIEYCGYYGWLDNTDSVIDMSKLEAQKFLGKNL